MSSSLFAKRIRRGALFLLTGLLFFDSSIAQEQLRGLVFEHDRYNSLPLPYDYGKREPLPPDATVRQFLPRIVNQAGHNAAVAWSTVWYANTILEASVRNITADDPKHRDLPLSPGFVYRMVTAAGCDSAVSLIDVLESLKNHGAPRFSEYRYFCPDELTDDVKRLGLGNRLPGYVRLFNSYDPGETKVRALKKALSKGVPVVAGIICPPSFRLAEAFWQPRELEVDEKYGGHALTVVGYDDAKFGGAFEVANTWGPRWGKDGLTWIRYADISRHFLYAFTLLRPGFPLEGAVVFAQPDGTIMPVSRTEAGAYVLDNTYATGDKFNIALKARKGVFCTAIVSDATGAPAVVFPTDTMTSTFFSGDLWLPGAASYFTLTEPAGRNKLYFLFSERQEKLRNVVDAILNKQSYPRPEGEFSKWRDDRVQFESTEDVVVVVVELDQR